MAKVVRRALKMSACKTVRASLAPLTQREQPATLSMVAIRAAPVMLASKSPAANVLRARQVSHGPKATLFQAPTPCAAKTFALPTSESRAMRVWLVR